MFFFQPYTGNVLASGRFFRVVRIRQGGRWSADVWEDTGDLDNHDRRALSTRRCLCHGHGTLSDASGDRTDANAIGTLRNFGRYCPEQSCSADHWAAFTTPLRQFLEMLDLETGADGEEYARDNAIADVLDGSNVQ